MTASYTLIETRQISGLGTIRMPSGASPGGSRVDYLLFDLLRPASNRYRNFGWFPPRERIANLTFRRNTAVLRSEVVEFPRQGFYEYPDPGGQVLAAVQCSYKGILETFFNLGNALALPSISVNNDIKEWTRFETPFDEIVIQCYADAAVQVILYQLVYETCGTDSGLFQFLDVNPPLPDPVAPGQPIIPSPPYDDTDPNEPYAPAGIDSDQPSTGFIGFTTEYRGSADCNVPPDDVIFVYPDTESPVAAQLGSPICTDSFKWSFSPDPIGYYFNGTWVSPGVAALWNGSSNFDAVVDVASSVPAPPGA